MTVSKRRYFSHYQETTDSMGTEIVCLTGKEILCLQVKRQSVSVAGDDLITYK